MCQPCKKRNALGGWIPQSPCTYHPIFFLYVFLCSHCLCCKLTGIRQAPSHGRHWLWYGHVKNHQKSTSQAQWADHFWMCFKRCLRLYRWYLYSPWIVQCVSSHYDFRQFASNMNVTVSVIHWTARQSRYDCMKDRMVAESGRSDMIAPWFGWEWALFSATSWSSGFPNGCPSGYVHTMFSFLRDGSRPQVWMVGAPNGCVFMCSLRYDCHA